MAKEHADLQKQMENNLHNLNTADELRVEAGLPSLADLPPGGAVGGQPGTGGPPGDGGGTVVRGAQGAAVGTGSQLVFDAAVRARYVAEAEAIGAKYGDTFAGMIKRLQLKQSTYAQLTGFGKAYTEALNKARRAAGKKPGTSNPGKTNRGVNQSSGKWGKAGKALGGVGVVISGKNLYDGHQEGRLAEAAIVEGGAWAGALSYGYAGAAIGGFVGGPVGAAIGGLVGGIVGGILGAEAGEVLAEDLVGEGTLN